MKKVVLKVSDLQVKLNNENVINNLSFSVSRGDFLTILGPNGSGKTVLFKSLLKLIPHQKGNIHWDKNVKIGYLPQGLTQLKLKNVPILAKEFLLLKKISLKKIHSLLRLVGISDKDILNKQLGNLSGGQFQRILLAWTLASDPNILLFDEPTTGIDIQGEKNIYTLLRKMQKRKDLTVLLITHDFNIIYKYSTNVLCLSKNIACKTKPLNALSSENLEKLYGMPVKFYKHNHN